MSISVVRTVTSRAHPLFSSIIQNLKLIFTIFNLKAIIFPKLFRYFALLNVYPVSIQILMFLKLQLSFYLVSTFFFFFLQKVVYLNYTNKF